MVDVHTIESNWFRRSGQQGTAIQQFIEAQADQRTQLRSYERLIPLERPQPGEQYRFEVDLDRCTGCKSCAAACHSLNGLDTDESWRRVGLLRTDKEDELPFLQTLTSACHHCAEPACMHGCPVQAYTKDPVSGIVRHLDDQCIGCQYCTMTCPYEVPRYNPRLGIVRKCDMCSQRLARDEAPACAQACPTEAIRIGKVAKEQLYQPSHHQVLPGLPAPEHTLPSTRYHSQKSLPDETSGGFDLKLSAEPAHLPLVVMLILTQWAVGAFSVDLLLTRLWPGYHSGPWFPILTTGIAWLGLQAAVFHLGRPLLAFRAFLGFRTSWMSREIVLFGLFFASAIGLCLQELPRALGRSIDVFSWPSTLDLSWLVVFLGLAAVTSSVMIYAVTSRLLWNFARSGRRFFATTFLLGAGFCLLWATFTLPSAFAEGAHLLGGVLSCVILAKLFDEALFLRHLSKPRGSMLQRSARLLIGPVRLTTGLRFAFGLLAAASLFAWSQELLATGHTMLLTLSFLSLLIGECLERLYFFQAVAFPKMPGALV